MGKWRWYLHRLRAMSLAEVAWRLMQKREERRERCFSRHLVSVGDHVLDARLRHLALDEHRLGIAFDTDGHTLACTIPLLGGYDYAVYKRRWHAGFQTPNEWPLTFAYDLDYKQNDHIGDARTNWELHRHFQFALLAKAFYYSGDERHRQELQDLLGDWCKQNPYLMGIAWTSVMEVAIRAINWMFTLAYMKASGKADDDLIATLNTGIVNMLDYVERHHSRYSSANNHLIVEATALLLGGYALGHASWRAKGIDILTEEVGRQTFADGVNKEMSLHYQVFVMEAYALAAHCMATNGDNVPTPWLDSLEKMCAFVSHSCFDDRHAMAFGDDDEGKIVDLAGGAPVGTDVVLQLCSLVTGHRHSPFSNLSETVRCLFDDEAITRLRQQPLFATGDGHCFATGGYTFMRSHDRHVLLGIDHAPLGFGTIAAHGHADALSFQLMVDGLTLFADPGTYIYHCDLAARNRYRQTREHNTVAVEGRDQSEMLGAFIWGRKAQCRLIGQHRDGDHWVLTAEHDGYSPIIHRRTFDFDLKARRLTITDQLSQPCRYTLSFVLGSRCTAETAGQAIDIRCGQVRCQLHFEPHAQARIESALMSERYGQQADTTAIRLESNLPQMQTIIDIQP